jgi:hypothetical protein
VGEKPSFDFFGEPTSEPLKRNSWLPGVKDCLCFSSGRVQQYLIQMRHVRRPSFTLVQIDNSGLVRCVQIGPKCYRQPGRANCFTLLAFLLLGRKIRLVGWFRTIRGREIAIVFIVDVVNRLVVVPIFRLVVARSRLSVPVLVPLPYLLPYLLPC